MAIDLTKATRPQLVEEARRLGIPPAGKQDAELKKLIQAKYAAPAAAAKPVAAVTPKATTPTAPAAKAPVAAAAKPATVPPKAPVQTAKPVTAAPVAKATPAAAPVKAAPTQAAAKPAAAAGPSVADIMGRLTKMEMEFNKALAAQGKTIEGLQTQVADLAAQVKDLKENPVAVVEAAAVTEEGGEGAEFELTHASIDSANFEILKAVCASEEVGPHLPGGGSTPPKNPAQAKKWLHDFLNAQEAAAAAPAEGEVVNGVSEEAAAEGPVPFEAIDRAARAALLGGEFDPLTAEEIGDRMPVYVCAPEDQGFQNEDGSGQVLSARVRSITDDGLFEVEIYNEDGSYDTAPVPAWYLYGRDEDGIYSEETKPAEG